MRNGRIYTSYIYNSILIRGPIVVRIDYTVIPKFSKTMMIWTVIGYSMDRIYCVEARAAMSSVDASVVIITKTIADVPSFYH